MTLEERIEEDRVSLGAKVLTLRGPAGYEDEQISLSLTSSNGLRLQIFNDDLDGWAVFHFHTASKAKLIAERLIEWADSHLSTLKGEKPHE